MKDTKENKSYRTRLYQERSNGEYLDVRQYLVVSLSLGITHIFLEFMYIYLGCTPMVYINVFSFLIYVVSIILILKGHHLQTVWIMETEIFLHVIFACIFMGYNCGYQLWLYGTFSSLFLPFFIPNLSRKPRMQIGLFVVFLVIGFEILTFLNNHDYLPTKYKVSDEVASFLYYFNAAIGFGSIMIYTSIYNYRMSVKNKELQHVADHDALTGMYNRQKTQSILQAEVQRVNEDSGAFLAIAILDIDFFKRINDTYGHQAGDMVLKSFAVCLKKYQEQGLLYGRWGGEEFILISPDDVKDEEFFGILENIRKDVEKNDFVSGNQHIKVTVSIGAAVFHRGMSVDRLIKIADEKLYTAKESGRNRVLY